MPYPQLTRMTIWGNLREGDCELYGNYIVGESIKDGTVSPAPTVERTKNSYIRRAECETHLTDYLGLTWLNYGTISVITVEKAVNQVPVRR